MELLKADQAVPDNANRRRYISQLMVEDNSNAGQLPPNGRPLPNGRRQRVSRLQLPLKYAR